MAKSSSAFKLKVQGFQWDEGNINKNLGKHKVTIQECEDVFYNQPLLIFQDQVHSKEKKRMVAYGKTDRGRRLTIIFTFRKNLIRIISAREQSRKERKVYEKA